MTAAAAQPVIRSTCEGSSQVVRSCLQGMIDLPEAVRRTANSEHYTGSKTSEAIRAWVRRLVEGVDDPEVVVREGGRVWLAPSVHPALSEPPSRVVADGLAEVSEGRRNRVCVKLQILRELEAFRRSRRLGKTEARTQFAEGYREHYRYCDGERMRVLRVTADSLRRWQQSCDQGGVEALARDGRGRWERGGPSAEAVALYWRLRNDPRNFTVAHCWRDVANEARRRGWRWFDKPGTCGAWDRRTRNERALILNQQGVLKYQQKAGRYFEPDPESFAPGQCWVGDDHAANVWIRTPGGKVIRPVLSTWQDWRSRVVGGWCLVPDGNEHSLLLAFGKFADGYGHLPERIISDNGKNFTSWQWTGGRPRRRVYRKAGELARHTEGIFALCGITPSWALPYNPNAKRIERWFRTLDEQFCKSLPSYCGRSPETRPGAHKELVAKAVEWDDFVAGLDRYIRAYNDRPHSAEDMERRTPNQVMRLAERKRVLDQSVRALLLAAWSRPVKVHRNGVSVKIAGKSVNYGWDEPAIQALPIGTQVRVAFNPEDIGMAWVWTMDYRFIAQVSENQRFNRAVPSEPFRETMREIRREKRALREAGKVGLDHLRDPMQRTVAALERDSARRRLPDPPEPDGGPLLIPVQTPIEVPAPEQLLRKAAGAENMDVHQRMVDFVKRPSGKGGPKPIATRLQEWAQREQGRGR